MYVHVHKLFDKGKVHGEDPYPWLQKKTLYIRQMQPFKYMYMV